MKIILPLLVTRCWCLKLLATSTAVVPFVLPSPGPPHRDMLLRPLAATFMYLDKTMLCRAVQAVLWCGVLFQLSKARFPTAYAWLHTLSAWLYTVHTICKLAFIRRQLGGMAHCNTLLKHTTKFIDVHHVDEYSTATVGALVPVRSRASDAMW